MGNLSEDKVVQYLKAGLCLLPEANRNLLRWLFGFLVDLAKFQEHNRMTNANIATVIGPNIMRQKDESAFDLVTNAPIVNGVCMSILKYYDQVLRSDDYDVPFRAIGRIIYPFEGSADEDQITLVQDEIVYIREINRDGDGWWFGETRGHQGMFPGSYVKVGVIYIYIHYLLNYLLNYS